MSTGTLHWWRSNTTGTFRRDDDVTDLAGYLREYQPGGYCVARVNEVSATGAAA
ncbi:hypothetical protein ACL02O_30280 [Micromonospora sp. MS34]|uniref:hypothetical protein n=1 Tax=Micromonospora sp. MS34 TaxID=3385971 RepID=UPI0039A1FD23